MPDASKGSLNLFRKNLMPVGLASIQGLGFFATVIGVFRYGGDISDCNGGFLQRC